MVPFHRELCEVLKKYSASLKPRKVPKRGHPSRIGEIYGPFYCSIPFHALLEEAIHITRYEIDLNFIQIYASSAFFSRCLNMPY